jgi:hypothetical protein
MKQIIKYACGICDENYDTSVEAEQCEAKGLDAPVAEVGDIVFLRAGFGWFDGDVRWVLNPDVLERVKKIRPNPHGNCFSDCCTYKFYYVITAIDNYYHRRRYHVKTKAMTGEQGYRGGYTFAGDHVKPIVVKEPPRFIIEDSKDLIGQKDTVLY